MKQEIRIAGIGGQGVILLGTVLARAFALYEDLHTVQTTFYSAAYRGGLSTTDIIVTDEELYDLTVQTPSCLVLTAKKAFTANKGLFNTAQCIIIDTHNVVIDEEFRRFYQDKSFLYDLQAIAKEQHLKSRSANMIMLGIIGKKSGIVSLESLIHALRDIVKKDTDDNIKAVTIGYSLV